MHEIVFYNEPLHFVYFTVRIFFIPAELLRCVIPSCVCRMNFCTHRAIAQTRLKSVKIAKMQKVNLEVHSNVVVFSINK